MRLYENVISYYVAKSSTIYIHYNIMPAQQLLVAGPLHSNCSICSPPSVSARDRAETSATQPGEATASALSPSGDFGRIL